MPFGHIGKTTGHKTLDNMAHVINMVRGTRLDCGRQAAQCCDITVKLCRGRLCYFADGLVQRRIRIITRGALVDFIIDIRDVTDIGDMTLAIDRPQKPEQHVKNNHRPRIANMGVIVNSRATDIHPHLRGIDRLKQLLAPA